ncbi:MAG TPA: lysophospholipid acyltransferase family protein [Stellaceae bacterium]|nr:lysophospholipid acyltransferase family protein [Stellaceae bacterium]
MSPPKRPPRRWLRRILRSRQSQAALCWLVQLYIRLVFVTNRWRVEGGDIPRRLQQDGRGLLVAFWHGRMMMIPRATPRLAPLYMLISGHRDGRLIAGAMGYFDVGYIAGSTRRGGARAFREMVKHLAEGAWVGITPDGPRGPAMQASAGMVNIARLARAPIVPLVYATTRRRILNSWDRFYLALPFGRGLYLWGEPIEIASDLDDDGLESARLLVESRMNDLAGEADRLVAAPRAQRAARRGAFPAAERG